MLYLQRKEKFNCDADVNNRFTNTADRINITSLSAVFQDNVVILSVSSFLIISLRNREVAIRKSNKYRWHPGPNWSRWVVNTQYSTGR
jgi:hypothetical protein